MTKSVCIKSDLKQKFGTHIYIYIYIYRETFAPRAREESKLDPHQTKISQNLALLTEKAETLRARVSSLQGDSSKKLEILHVVQKNELSAISRQLESSQQHKLKEMQSIKSIRDFKIDHIMGYTELLSLFKIDTQADEPKTPPPVEEHRRLPPAHQPVKRNPDLKYTFPGGKPSITLRRSMPKHEILGYAAEPALPSTFRLRVLLSNQGGHPECMMVGLVLKYFKPKERGYIGNSTKEWGVTPNGYTNGHSGGSGYIDTFENGSVFSMTLNKDRELTFSKEGGAKTRTFYGVPGPLYFATSFCYADQEVEILEVLPY